MKKETKLINESLYGYNNYPQNKNTSKKDGRKYIG